jgi:formate-dependent nitrite reductase membrane component NrfD
MFAAQPWDWWIALVLFLLGVLGVLAVVFGYLIKVVGPQYPRRGQTIVESRQQQKS